MVFGSTWFECVSRPAELASSKRAATAQPNGPGQSGTLCASIVSPPLQSANTTSPLEKPVDGLSVALANDTGYVSPALGSAAQAGPPSAAAPPKSQLHQAAQQSMATRLTAQPQQKPEQKVGLASVASFRLDSSRV